MGLEEMLTVYVWNWFVYIFTTHGLQLCWWVGLWGLFWLDDDGQLIDACLDLWNGNDVEFPLDYDGLAS